MLIRKSICSEDMTSFPYHLGLLCPLMYGYATVSYNQTLDHLKFRLTLTVITTAILKVKFALGKRR